VNTVSFKPKAYLKEGCPFSFKLLLFLAESGLAHQVEVIRCNPETPQFDAIRSRLQAGLRKPATFPTVEVEPNRYLSESDALIEHFASKHQVDIGALPALSFYLQTIFPQLLRLHEDGRK
jgi:glutathione S-transferase